MPKRYGKGSPERTLAARKGHETRALRAAGMMSATVRVRNAENDPGDTAENVFQYTDRMRGLDPSPSADRDRREARDGMAPFVGRQTTLDVNYLLRNEDEDVGRYEHRVFELSQGWTEDTLARVINRGMKTMLKSDSDFTALLVSYRFTAPAPADIRTPERQQQFAKDSARSVKGWATRHAKAAALAKGKPWPPEKTQRAPRRRQP